MTDTRAAIKRYNVWGMETAEHEAGDFVRYADHQDALREARAPLRWTKEKPTEPGYYWWKSAIGHGVLEVKFVDGEFRYACGGAEAWFPVRLLGGEWAGPLEVPE